MTANQLTVFPPEPILTTSLSIDQPALPNGWKWVKLGDVIALSSEKYQPKEAIEYYVGLEHIEKGTGRISERAQVEPISTIKNSFRTGEILYGKLRPYLNKVALAACDGVCSTDILVLRPKETVAAKYVHYFMLRDKFVNDMSANSMGVNLPRVPTKYVLGYSFPLPPLAEQQRIVAKIEELFSEIDAGIREVETALQRLKIYQQAVLHHFLNNDEWERVKLSEVADMCLGKMLDRAKNKGTLKPYLRNINVRWGRFDLDDLLLMRFEDTEDERYGIKIGDLIVCEGGEPGRAAIWKGETQEAKIQKALHRVRFKPTVQVEFFYYFLLISSYNGYLSKFFTGTTIKHLTSKEFAKFKLPLPDLPIQTQIVQEIEARLSEADALKKTLRTELQRAERLRQSVLKQAFSGGPTFRQLLKTDAPASQPA